MKETLMIPMMIQFFGAFNGLGSNEIFASIDNMIISQTTHVDNIAGTYGTLVDEARVDGSLYGDRKLFYDTDALKSYPWGADAEATNLLQTHRPHDPKCQEIVLDVFRQIPLTIDYYLSKRAWGTEGAFSQFNSVMLGWITDTKRVYDSTTYNAFIGTDETAVGRQKISITLPTNTDPEIQARLRGQLLGREVANLIVDLKDSSRDFNDYGFLRSYNIDDLIFVWNSEALNQITKMDLPTIFHKDGLIEKLGQYVLPARYFGKVKTAGGKTSAENTTIRSLIEQDFNTVDFNNSAYDNSKHVFAGDLLPGNTDYEANTTYEVDNTILFKIYRRGAVPFMSAFETATSFYNPKALNENHYLTWGHNHIEHLSGYPMITVRGVTA